MDKGKNWIHECDVIVTLGGNRPPEFQRSSQTPHVIVSHFIYFDFHFTQLNIYIEQQLDSFWWLLFSLMSEVFPVRISYQSISQQSVYWLQFYYEDVRTLSQVKTKQKDKELKH